MDYYTQQEFKCRICLRQACGPPHALINNPTTPLNLIQLCQICHRGAIYRDIPIGQLIAAIAERESISISEVRRANNIY